MPGFRLYCLNEHKQITARVDFDAADDLAAVAFARAHYPDDHCEVWELGRLVARVPHDHKVQFIEV